MMLLDSHYHYDFLPPAMRQAFLERLALDDVHLIAQTTTPSGFLRLEQDEAAALAGVSVGFHPWYIGADWEAELEVFAAALQRTRFVGEVGLDFAPRRLEAVPAERQEDVLRGVLAAVAARARDADAGDLPLVLSIHTVRSASRVLGLLEECGAGGSIVPVFHRFGGTSDELTRLIRGGGYISVNPLMLGAKKGRAYVTQVPAGRLLLESDLPESTKWVGEASAELREALLRVVRELAALRGVTVEKLATVLQENARALYGCE